MVAWKTASSSADGVFLIGSSTRRLLNQSNRSSVAQSTGLTLRDVDVTPPGAGICCGILNTGSGASRMSG